MRQTYKYPTISRKKLEELIEIKAKLVSTDAPSDVSMLKLGGKESRTTNKMVKYMLKFLPLTIYQIMIGENQLLNICKILRGMLVERLNIEH